MDVIQSLLSEVIAEGRKQGLDQGDIVHRAGLGASTLSKAKAANDLRLSTLVRMANAVGLKLSLTSNQPSLERIMNRDVFGQSGMDS